MFVEFIPTPQALTMLSSAINGLACSLGCIAACSPLILSYCPVESQSYCTMRCPWGAPSGDRFSAAEAKP